MSRSAPVAPVPAGPALQPEPVVTQGLGALLVALRLGDHADAVQLAHRPAVDTEGCERALASAWSLSDEVNLEDQAVRFRWLRARATNQCSRNLHQGHSISVAFRNPRPRCGMEGCEKTITHQRSSRRLRITRFVPRAAHFLDLPA